MLISLVLFEAKLQHIKHEHMMTSVLRQLSKHVQAANLDHHSCRRKRVQPTSSLTDACLMLSGQVNCTNTAKLNAFRQSASLTDAWLVRF